MAPTRVNRFGNPPNSSTIKIGTGYIGGAIERIFLSRAIYSYPSATPINDFPSDITTNYLVNTLVQKNFGNLSLVYTLENVGTSSISTQLIIITGKL